MDSVLTSSIYRDKWRKVQSHCWYEIHSNVTVCRCYSIWLSHHSSDLSALSSVGNCVCLCDSCNVENRLHYVVALIPLGESSNLIHLIHGAPAFSETFAVLHWEMSLINGCIPVQYCPHRVHTRVIAFWCLSLHFIDLRHVAPVMSCYVCYANTKLLPINWCIAWKFNELWGTLNGSVKAWAMCTVSSALLIRR